MRLRTPRGEFGQAARTVARGLPTVALVPAYNGMVLHAGGELVTLCGFDGSTTIRHTAPAHVLEPGRVLLPGRLVADIAANATGAEIEISVEQGDVTVVCGTSRYTLPPRSLDDYPELPAHPEPTGTTPAAGLAAAVRHTATIAANATTTSTAANGGIHLLADGDTLTVNACDHYRSAVHVLPWDGSDGQAIIPAKPLALATAALTDQNATLALPAGENAGVGDGRHRSTLRRIDAPWPDLSRAYPGPGGATVELDAAELVAAIKQVDLVTDDKIHTLKLEFTTDGLTMHAGDGLTAAYTHLDATLHGTAHLRVVYQTGYLRIGLEPLTGTARLTLPAAGGGHLLGAPHDDRYHCLLMPVRDPWTSEDGS